MLRRCPCGFREFLCDCLCQGAHDAFWANPLGVESAPGLARAPSQPLSALHETANLGAARSALPSAAGGVSFSAIVTPSISDPSLPRGQEPEGRETR